MSLNVMLKPTSCRPSEKEEHTEGVFEVSIDASEEEVVNKAVKAVSAGVGFKILEQ